MAIIRQLEYLKFVIFGHVTVIEFLICCCVPKFHQKLVHAFGLQTYSISAKCSIRGC